MTGPCSELFWLMVLLSSLRVSTATGPSVPPIDCPVGITLDAALYFKTLDGVTSPASVTATINNMNDSQKRAQLETELDPLIGLNNSQLSALSNEEIIDVATLYYGLTEVLEAEQDTTGLNQVQLRELAEVTVSAKFTGLAKEFLLWTFGSLSDRQLILLACSAEFLVPADLPFKLGETALCYNGQDDFNTASVTTFDTSATGDLPCRQKCRTEGFKVHLSKEQDDNCYCSNSGLRERQDCDSTTFHYSSAGLGAPLLSQQVQPTGYSYQLNKVKDSSFLHIGNRTFNIVLFEKAVAVFNLSAPERWEDSDDTPDLSYVDLRKWDSSSGVNISFDDLAEEKNLVELHDPDEYKIPNIGGTYDQVRLPNADSMTILPIFVTMDEQFYPDVALAYDEDSYDDIDYEDPSWQDNLAGRPHPGGKWFYHILISHKSKSSKRTSHPPDMTMIRILENGTLVHMMEYKTTPKYGRFKVPSLKKNVVQMISLVRGRESFFLTASITPNAKFLRPETYSKIQAWKMTETMVGLTYTGKTSFFEPVKHGETIQVYSEARLAKVDFFYKMFIAVLDRSTQDGADSRVRLFSFFYSDVEKDYYLDTNPTVTELFRGQVFTNLHSFVSEGSRYIVISRAGTTASDLNTCKIFLVSSDGSLSQVGSDMTSPSSAGVLLDVKPAPAEFSGTNNLLEFKRIGTEANFYTTVQVLSHEGGAGWLRDPNQVMRSAGSSSHSPVFDVTGVRGQMRLITSSVREAPDDQLEFDLFVIPRLPSHHVDQRLMYESQLAVKIYGLDSKLSQDGGQHLHNLHNDASIKVNQYVQKAGSVVTGDWNIIGINTGSVEASSIPEQTKVTINIRNEEGQVTSFPDWRDVLEVDMMTVEEKLDNLETKLDDLAALYVDLLELDADETQVVTSSITVENLNISESLKFPQPNPFMLRVLASENDTLLMSDITNIYSSSQNNVPISGTSTFNEKVVLNDDLDTVQLASELSEDETVTVTTSSLLKLVAGQTISRQQVFSAGVSVESDLQFSDGLKVSSPGMGEDLDFDDIPLNDLSGHFTLSQVVLPGPGLSAPHLDGSFPSDLNVDQLVPKEAESVQIVGTLKFQSSEFVTFGRSVGVVDGDVNDHNVSALYENVAWREAPESVHNIHFDSVLTFPAAAVFTGNVSFEDVIEVKEVNGIEFSDYLQIGSLGNGTLQIGGDKTLNSPSQFDQIFASSFNSLTVDQLVDKHSTQSVAASRFQAGVTLDDILGAADDGSQPTVDGIDLVGLASTNVPGFVDRTVSGSSLPVETAFSVIVIESGASVTVKNKINDIQLADRVPHLVRLDEASVTITGDKSFSRAVSAADVKIKNVKADYDTASQSYTDTFVFTDFVNTQNPQSIGGGKTFSGNSTFGDMFFIKANSKVNSVKMAPLLECWVDINSADDVLVIDEPVKFMSLVTDGLSISRLDASSRKCNEVEDSLHNIYDWLEGKVIISQEVQDLISSRTTAPVNVDLAVEFELAMENLALGYLMTRCPPGSLDNVAPTGETGLTALTYLTVTMEDLGVSISDLVQLTVEEKRSFVNHHIASTHGVYLSQLQSMTSFQVVKLTCRLPRLNSLDVVNDAARLSEDNQFCSEESQCSQTFSADFESDDVKVEGNLQTSSPVFGVRVSSLASQRVSLSSGQTLSGNYSFSQLSVDHSFQGEILYRHGGSQRSLAGFRDRFLKKSESGDQTFTESGLVLTKLTSSDSVITGGGELTSHITVGGSQYDIKAIYDQHLKYDDTVTFSEDLILSGELRVTDNIVVGGGVQELDLSALASDLVISGASVEVPAGGGEDVGYTISGTDDTVHITGRKSFSVSPTVSGDIMAAREDDVLLPVVVTDSKEVQFSSGLTETRIMKRTEAQTITGAFTVNGNVLFESGLATSGFGGVDVAEVHQKYEYDSSQSVHVLKTNFNFQGRVTVGLLTSEMVRAHSWADFVADTIPVSSSDLQSVSGHKLFSGHVKIDHDECGVGSFNGIDLDTVWEEQVFINRPATFSSANFFSFSDFNRVNFEPDSNLRALTSITLVDPEIQTVENSVFDVAFVYSNSIPLRATDPVAITGRLVFTSNLTLHSDSTVGSLGKPEAFTINIPDDLILLDSTSLSFSVGMETHQFEGANFISDLKLTGNVGGYSLLEFDNVLYKSTTFGSTKLITGTKTFEKVTLSGDMTSRGDVNGLDLVNNLVYLDAADKTLEGTYSFNEIQLNNLQVTGLVDGVDWNDVHNHLFYASVPQNVSANFRFDSPTSLTFKGAIIGDGLSSNGLGTVNNLTVESINGLDSTWETVAAVKTAAQAEASVLCSHVKTLAGAYLANMKVSHYTYHVTSHLHHAGGFGKVVDLTPLNVGDSVFLVAISQSKVRLLMRTKTEEAYDVIDLTPGGLEVELMQGDGRTPLENARQVEVVANVVNAREVGAAASVGLVIADQGAVLIRISGSLGENNVEMTQVGEPIPHVIGVKFIPEISTFFVAFQTPFDGGYRMKVMSLPYPDYYFVFLLLCLETGSSTVDCLSTADWYSDLYLVWQGETFTEKIERPHFDALLDDNNRVFLAVSNHFHTSTLSYVSSMRVAVLSWSRGADTAVMVEGNQLLMQVASDDFVLLSSNHLGLLITGGEKVSVTKIDYDENSFSEVTRFSLPAGPASQLRRHSNGLVTALEDGANLVFMKYAGFNGVKVDGTLYLHNHPVLAYTFFNSITDDKVSENLLLTANENNQLYLYKSKANFEGKTMDLHCRNPEVGVSEKTSQYCDISSEHTMCKFNKKSESCNITMNNIHDLQNGFDVVLLDEHNKYRSQIARSETIRSDLPPGGDMRKLSWEPELARLAEMWAAQCSSQHEAVRRVIINGEELDYAQNLIAFKGKNDWAVGEASMKEMVRYWYNELTSLHLGYISSYTYRSDTEHFTQLAWSKTSKLGCGWTQYVDETDSYPFVSLVVCNYLEEGNKPGQQIYSEAPACSDCGHGYICEGDSGLCIPSS